MEVSFPTDPDGFLSQECQSCGQRFKVLFGEGSDQPISCCPYCGYRSQDGWHTSAQLDYMQAIALNVALLPELAKFERQLKGMSNGLLKFEVNSNISEPSTAPMETDEAFDLLHFQCCNETVKVVRHDRHFCIICGLECFGSA